jgi:hypothetical protein
LTYPTPLGSFITPPGLPVPQPTGQPLFGGRVTQRVRGPIVVVPSLSVVEEYNDNIFLDNDNRKSDFITAISPGLSLTLEDPSYRVSAAYSFTSLLYADQTDFNAVRGRELATLEALYRVTPRLTLSIADTYLRSENSNVGSLGGLSIGLVRTTSNSLVPAVTYSLDPQTTLRAFGAWTTESFDTAEASDSDTYRGEGYVDYALTQRLTLTGGYAFAYYDVEGIDPVQTHTPLFGGTYRFTPTLTATALAGPQFVLQEDESEVKWTARVDIRQRFSWGALGVAYTHDLSTTGGLGQIAETDTVVGQLQVDRLVRGLVLALTPRYTTTSSSSGSQGDVRAFNVALQGAYQLTSWLTLTAAYNFFDQRTSSGGFGGAISADQNRVFVGLQFAYPIRVQ